MKGQLFVYRAPAELSVLPEVIELEAVPGLDKLQELVGGHIELVPYFITIGDRPCIAYVNEWGKIGGRWGGVDFGPLPVNRRATLLWDAACRRAIGKGLQVDGEWLDYLVGTVVVLTGDDKFMRALRK